MIEVEKKAFISEAEFTAIPQILLQMGAEHLGNNDTVSVFYLVKDAQLKIQSRPLKNQLKIAWKSGGFDGSNARKELEANVDYSDYDSLVSIFDNLLQGDVKKVETSQIRHDYRYKDVSIAIKHSENWNYHVEFDITVSNKNEVESALAKINRIAEELKVNLLSDEQEKAHTDKIIASIK